MWNLKQHGDFLERKFAQFVDENIPAYSKIWCIYIGNDGTAHAAKLEQHNPEGIIEIPMPEEQRRISFSEHLYTCLESLLLLRHLLNKDYKLKENFDDYFNLQNDFLAFHANSGRIRDNIEKMFFLFYRSGDDPEKLNAKAQGLLNELNDYYQKRNDVLHGKKLPFGSIEGEFLIVIPKGASESDLLWNSNKNWDDMGEGDLEFAIKYLNDTLQGIISIVNRLLSNILDRISATLKENNYKLTDPPEESGLNGSSGIGYSGFKG